MIYRERGPTPPQLDLDNPLSLASIELVDARAHFQKNGVGPLSEWFKAFAHSNVRKEIHRQFDGKCIYCESSVEIKRVLNVEHYRPKSEVTGTDHPGYWWLAMRWENLLPSCPNCNSATYHHILDPELSVDEIAEMLESDRGQTLRGKQNFFPTEDEVWATEESVHFSIEKPLILDPTLTDPEPLFLWVPIGCYMLALPRDDNLQAHNTIEILGLNRVDLCTKRMRDVAGARSDQALLARHLHSEDSSWVSDEMILEQVNDYLKSIKSRTLECQTHAGVARYIMSMFKRRLTEAVS